MQFGEARYGNLVSSEKAVQGRKQGQGVAGR